MTQVGDIITVRGEGKARVLDVGPLGEVRGYSLVEPAPEYEEALTAAQEAAEAAAAERAATAREERRTQFLALLEEFRDEARSLLAVPDPAPPLEPQQVLQALEAVREEARAALAVPEPIDPEERRQAILEVLTTSQEDVREAIGLPRRPVEEPTEPEPVEEPPVEEPAEPTDPRTPAEPTEPPAGGVRGG